MLKYAPVHRFVQVDDYGPSFPSCFDPSDPLKSPPESGVKSTSAISSVKVSDLGSYWNALYETERR